MQVSESEIRRLVGEVLDRLSTNPAHMPKPDKGRPGIFTDVEKAVAAAADTQKQLQHMPMEFREKIIANIRKKTKENAQLLAEMGVRETGMGMVGHKILKHNLVAEKTPGTEDITTTAWSGDRGLTLVEQGPFGVIGAVTPSTNPSETIICNTIGMLAAGNTVVFNTHPNAKNVSNYAVELMNIASMEVHGPENIAVSIDNPTIETGNQIFKHPRIPLLVATGGPGVVTAILSVGKRGIGAGAGNPPVLVDETADIEKAAQDIINGASFDNNLPCIAEKEIVAVESICDELIFYLKEHGGYEAGPDEVKRLTEKVLINKDGAHILNRDCVGRSAQDILKMIGVEVGGETKCIIFRGQKEHPLICEELMMPILGVVRVKNVEEGIQTSVWLERGNRHSPICGGLNVPP